MSEFPSNSRSARDQPAEEPKRVERVTSVEAKRRKKGLGRQFKETFIAGDARGALRHVAISVLVPAAKHTLSEGFHDFVDHVIYGDARPRRGGGIPPATGRVDYPTPYHRMNAGPPNTARPMSGARMLSQTARNRHDFDAIEIPDRREAEEVLERMYDMLSQYGEVSVADLYGLTGIKVEHTDYKWGWRELRGSRVARLSSGRFLLDLPQPQSLE